jgi:hypothetical protein
VWRARVDDNEAILLREGLVRTAGVVGLSTTRAEMDRYDDTGRCSKLLWHINVEACFGRSSSKVGDLLKASRCWCTLAESGGGRHREVARDKGEETHCAVGVGSPLIYRRRPLG